jgi:hypothetical protein
MEILGIELTHPSPKQLLLSAAMIFVVAISLTAAFLLGILDSRSVWVWLVGSSTGILCSAFGISIRDHGWRAVVVLLSILVIAWALLLL